MAEPSPKRTWPDARCAGARWTPAPPTSGCSTPAAPATGCTPTRGACCASRPSSSRASARSPSSARRSPSSARPAPPRDHPEYALGRGARPRAGRGRLRGHHRRRSRARWRRPTRAPARPAGVASASASSCRSSRAQRVGRHRHQLPLLLRPQDDVREVRPGLRRPARRLRHPRRAVRGAHPGPDPQGHPVPGRAVRQRLLGRPGRLAARHRARPRQDLEPRTSACSPSPTTSTRRWS